MQDLAKLSELAAVEIDALIAEGISPTAAEIVELSALGWNSESPQMRLALSRGVPVHVGGVTLWPLTIEASDWFDRVGCRIGDGRKALAYAAGHCYADGSPFDCSGVGAVARVFAWWSRLKCTRQAIAEALAQIVAQDEGYEMPPRPGNAGMTLGEVSCHLAARCGGDVDFWERRCSAQYAFDALKTAVAQADATGESVGSDPKIQATRALGWAVEKIRSRHHGRG